MYLWKECFWNADSKTLKQLPHTNHIFIFCVNALSFPGYFYGMELTANYQKHKHWDKTQIHSTFSQLSKVTLEPLWLVDHLMILNQCSRTSFIQIMKSSFMTESSPLKIFPFPFIHKYIFLWNDCNISYSPVTIKSQTVWPLCQPYTRAGGENWWHHIFCYFLAENLSPSCKLNPGYQCSRQEGENVKSQEIIFHTSPLNGMLWTRQDLLNKTILKSTNKECF